MGFWETACIHWKNKDIFNDPYDNFMYGQAFSLVIPGNLSYMDVASRAGFKKIKVLKMERQIHL